MEVQKQYDLDTSATVILDLPLTIVTKVMNTVRLYTPGYIGYKLIYITVTIATKNIKAAQPLSTRVASDAVYEYVHHQGC